MTSTAKHGTELLRDPSLNKSTAFTEAEKQALGLVGLIPDVTETEDLQLQRVNLQLAEKPTDLERYIYLHQPARPQRNAVLPHRYVRPCAISSDCLRSNDR